MITYRGNNTYRYSIVKQLHYQDWYKKSHNKSIFRRIYLIFSYYKADILIFIILKLKILKGKTTSLFKNWF
ncbi:hypothetical protein BH23THE1_BH23THE1_35330 [soil metagenome]